jgi:hypothetical protein
MTKIKTALTALVTDKALWHFGADFLTLLVAGLGGIAAYLYVPADGNWKPVVTGLVIFVFSQAVPAFRRAWAENQDAIVQSLEPVAEPYLDAYQIGRYVELAKTLGIQINVPDIADTLNAAINAELAKMKVISNPATPA